MPATGWLARQSARRWAFAAGLGVLAIGVFTWLGGSRAASQEADTAEVVRGEFIEYLTMPAEVKAIRSAVVISPRSADNLQIVTLAPTGTVVKRGDVVVEFDRTTVERMLLDRRSQLRQAEAEIEKARANARIQEEATLTDQMKGAYDVERAKLDVGTRDVVSRLDAQKAEITLSDAQQRVKEVDARLGATRAGARAEMQGLIHKRDKALSDVRVAERNLASLTLRAPVDGQVLLLNNWRAGGPMSNGREFREGDRAWSGSGIAEIPDFSAVNAIARIDETDRGRVSPGLPATLGVEALPGVEFAAKLSTFSTLAKPDFATVPPTRNFDLTIDLVRQDPRLKPGMTATVRIPVDRLENVLLVPVTALVLIGERPHVRVVKGSDVELRPVTVLRRGKDRAAIAQGLDVGERVFVGGGSVPAGPANGSSPAGGGPAGAATVMAPGR